MSNAKITGHITFTHKDIIAKNKPLDIVSSVPEIGDKFIVTIECFVTSTEINTNGNLLEELVFRFGNLMSITKS